MLDLQNTVEPPCATTCRKRQAYGKKIGFKVKISGFFRPFYRYGGHIELIRFKEYYRMPRGHEQISFFYFRTLFGTFFLKVFLE